MRILSLTANFFEPLRHNWGHEHFRREIARQHEVFFCGPGHPYRPMRYVEAHKIVEWKGPFDLVLTVSVKFTRNWLRDMHRITTIPKAHIVLDYVVGKQFNVLYDSLFDSHKYDILFARTLLELENIVVARSEPIFYLPYSVDEKIYSDTGVSRDIDAAAIWSTGAGYPNRSKIQVLLRTMRRRRGRTKGLRSYCGRECNQAYVDLLRRSKIFVGSVGVRKPLAQKVTESMACGCLHLTDKPKDLERQGFVDGEHLVLYEGLHDLREKINYYLAHDSERKQIAEAGRDFVLTNHTTKLRVEQFTKILTEFLEKRE